MYLIWSNLSTGGMDSISHATQAVQCFMQAKLAWAKCMRESVTITKTSVSTILMYSFVNHSEMHNHTGGGL